MSGAQGRGGEGISRGGEPLALKWGEIKTLVAQIVKNLPAMHKTWVLSFGWEDPLENGMSPTPVFLGFPGNSDSKESTCNAGDLGMIPGLGRSPGGGNEASQAPGTSPTLPQPAPSRARTLEAGKRWARLAQARAASRPARLELG